MNQDTSTDASADVLGFTGKIVAAYVSNNPVPIPDLPGMIKSVHSTLDGLQNGVPDMVPKKATRLQIKKSLTPEYIVCFEDGKQCKMLKRHLRCRYGLTPDEYREKWGLDDDYPMVAANYAAERSTLAKKIGLGYSSPRTKKRKG